MRLHDAINNPTAKAKKAWHTLSLQMIPLEAKDTSEFGSTTRTSEAASKHSGTKPLGVIHSVCMIDPVYKRCKPGKSLTVKLWNTKITLTYDLMIRTLQTTKNYLQRSQGKYSISRTDPRCSQRSCVQSSSPFDSGRPCQASVLWRPSLTLSHQRELSLHTRLPLRVLSDKLEQKKRVLI